MNRKPAFVIGATKSGGGKTTLTLGMLGALVRRGFRVQPFKCGPDFIDPTLHEAITGRISYNLDLKMMGPQCCLELFQEKCATADIVVIEGVMGLFDGGEASTAELAKLLDIPVILVIDARSSAESCLAVLKGFELYDPEVEIAGVIFNKIGSERHAELIETERQAGRTSTPLIGFIPREEEFSIPERHLGLFMGSEKPLQETGIIRLCDSVDRNLDLDRIIQAGQIDLASIKTRENKKREKLKRIGIARDEAFCFYYQQNLELLTHAGFEIVYFSPIHDKTLPKDLDMIYFGGGYPENYARQLSRNEELKKDIRNSFNENKAIYAECGGFMYLCRYLKDFEGNSHEMAGLFPFTTVMGKRLRRLGYRRVTLQKDCFLGMAGDELFGHEFHYSDIEKAQDGPEGVEWLYSLDNNSQEGYHCGSAIGSYVHLHFGKTPAAINAMCNWKK